MRSRKQVLRVTGVLATALLMLLPACDSKTKLPPSERGLCVALLECIEDADLPGITEFRKEFGEEGACWSESDKSDCRHECAAALKGLREQTMEHASCQECDEGSECPSGECHIGHCVDPLPYGNPETGCNSNFDEKRVQLKGIAGAFCSPPCGEFDEGIEGDDGCPDGPELAYPARSVCGVLSGSTRRCMLTCDPDGALPCGLRGRCAPYPNGGFDGGHCVW